MGRTHAHMAGNADERNVGVAILLGDIFLCAADDVATPNEAYVLLLEPDGFL